MDQLKSFFSKRGVQKAASISLTLAAAWIVVPTIAGFCKKQTDGFSLLSVSSERPYNEEWEVHPLSREEKSEVDLALGQKYSYLACGDQAFVFVSEDERYVIKFLKQDLFSIPFWKKPFCSKKMAKRQDKLQRDFTSYKLAFDELKEETGLVLVHLTVSEEPRRITIIDKLNIEHRVDLSRMEFILQKRAELVYPRITRLVEQKDLEGAKKALSDLLAVLSLRCKKGIADSTPDLDKNFGFVGEKAVQIDIGKFCKDPSLVSTSFQPIRKKKKPYFETHVAVPVIRENFKEWLYALSPELGEHFNAEFERLVNERAFEL